MHISNSSSTEYIGARSEQIADEDEVWVVTLGDGTFIEVINDVTTPFIARVKKDFLIKLDAELGGEFPVDCLDENLLEHHHLDDIVGDLP